MALYYGKYPPGEPEQLGWLSLVLSGVTLAYNYISSAKKTENLSWESSVAVRASELQAEKDARASAAASAEKERIMNTVKKSLPIIGIIAAASIAGTILGRRK